MKFCSLKCQSTVALEVQSIHASVHGGMTCQTSVTFVNATAWSENGSNETLISRKEFYKKWITEVQTVAEVYWSYVCQSRHEDMISSHTDIIIQLLNTDPDVPCVITDHE